MATLYGFVSVKRCPHIPNAARARKIVANALFSPGDREEPAMSGHSGQRIIPVLLAGGKSTRMGRNKSFVPLAGRSMIEIVAGRIAAIFGEKPLLIVNRPEQYRHLGLPLVEDIYRGLGPMAGIHAALAHGDATHCFVFACDMPCLETTLIAAMRRLCDGHDAIVPRHDGRFEPLHAIYRKSCAPLLEARLRQGRVRLTDALARLRVRAIDVGTGLSCPHALDVFTNINTPGELDAFTARLPFHRQPVSATQAERT